MTALTISERFLRSVGPGRWDVWGDGERLGQVLLIQDDGLGYVFLARTASGNIPMPDGSVIAMPRRSYEDRAEPQHATKEDAAKAIVLAVETSRILNAQIAYERANGWSTD